MRLHVAAVLVAASVAACVSTESAPQARPHVVLILADDLGWTDLSTGRTNGGNGSPYHRTPNLDQLAAAGTCFTDAYSNGPNCAPTRAALWSGQWAARTGVYTVGGGNRGRAAFRQLDAADNRVTLAPETVTLAEVMRSAGYATAHFGKWHLGNQQKDASPTDQGFDHQVGGNQRGGVGSMGHFAGEDGSLPLPGMTANGKAGQFVADRLTDEAISWLGDVRDAPAFCCISHYSVHTPIQAPASDLDATPAAPPGSRHRHRRYAAMMKNLDDNVGRVMDFLATTDDPLRAGQKMLANTIVVFTSDNGGLGGYAKAGVGGGQEITEQSPLRSGKGSLHEGGVRVPFVVRWDARVAAGGVDATPLQLFDLYPTLARIAGAELPAGQRVDGADLSPRWLSPDAPVASRPLFWHFPGYLQANSKQGTWRTTPVSVVRDGDLKAMFWFETRTWTLYDLAADINEARDRAADRPGDLRRLASKLRGWLDRTGAPMPRAKGGAAVAAPAVPAHRPEVKRRG